MKKKKKNTKNEVKKVEDMVSAKVVKSPVSSVLKDNYMPYAMAVIVSRAIPSIDGLKPSQRKLLYTMYEMGLDKPSAQRKKSSTIVGHAMTYNPHGDQSMYETMIRLTTSNGTLLHPYIDSKGSWGHRYSDDLAAAHRYTEAKLSPFGKELFDGIKDDYVDFVPNFDNSTIEPELLPTKFPNILVNPSMGIAVGMASNIPSFNLREVCDATIAVIKNPKADIFKHIKAPDFSTGADIVLQPKEAKKILKEGRGSYTLKAKYKIDKKNRIIEVYEIPFTTTYQTIIEQIKVAVRDERMMEISDVRDESDLNGLKIAIDYKTTADVDVLISKLYKYTRLEDTFSLNLNLLIDGKPRVLGVKEIIQEWIKWRMESLRRGLRFKVDKQKEELHLLYGLEKILLDIDLAIKTIRNTRKASRVIINLMNEFDIDETQAEHVSRMMLRNINKEYITDKLKDVKDKEKEIKDLEAIISSDEKIGEQIIKDLEYMKEKFGQDRKTTIIDFEEHQETIVEDMSEDYNVRVIVTQEHFLKKIALTSLRGNAEIKYTDTDVVLRDVEVSNRGTEVIVLTNKQNAHKVYIDELDDHKPSEFGHFINNICEFEEGEEVLYSHVVVDEDYSGEFVIGYDNGKVARIPVSLFETKTRRKVLRNSLYDGAKVVGIHYITEPENIILISNLTRGLMFNSELIPLRQTRNTQGVQVLRMRKDEVATKLAPEERANIKSLTRYTTDKIPLAGVSSRSDII